MERGRGQMKKGGMRGVSVVEVLVALTLVAILLAGIYPLITQSHFSMRRGRDHYLAVSIGLATLEMARKHDYSLLPRMAEAQRLINDQGNYDSGGRFRRTIIVRPNTPLAGLTEMEVRIDIRDRRSGAFEGAAETLSMLYTTYLTVPNP